jgi:hypothetical protein
VVGPAGMFHNPYSIFLTELVPWDMPHEIFRTFYGIYPLLKKLFSIHFARKNFRVIRKCPTWDIIPKSPFVSIKRYLQIISNFATCGPPYEGRNHGSWIMDIPD